MENHSTISRQNVWINFNNQFGHTWLNIISIKSKTFKDSLTSNMSHLNSLLQSHILPPTVSKIFQSEIVISPEHVSLKFFPSEWATGQYSIASPPGASLDHRFRVDYHLQHYLNHATSFFRSWKLPFFNSDVQVELFLASRNESGVQRTCRSPNRNSICAGFEVTNKHGSSWK